MFQVLLLLVSGSVVSNECIFWGHHHPQKTPAKQRCAKAEEFEHVSLVKIFRLAETSVGISLAGVVWCVGYFCSSGLARFGFFKVRTLGEMMMSDLVRRSRGFSMPCVRPSPPNGFAPAGWIGNP